MSFTIYGSESSPYSIKVRAYARHKRLSFTWENARTSPGYHKVAKIPIIPAVRAPDGSGAQDSTPIMERWDLLYPDEPDRSAHPDHCATLRFLSDLLEEFGDEWANKWMFHYRWARPIDRRVVALRLAHEMLEVPPGVDGDRVDGDRVIDDDDERLEERLGDGQRLENWLGGGDGVLEGGELREWGE